MGLENVPDAQSQNRNVKQCFQATAGSQLPKCHHESTFLFFFLNFFFLKVITHRGAQTQDPKNRSRPLCQQSRPGTTSYAP